MNILLKSAKIIDPTSSFHGNTLDILIRNGIIDKIDKSIDAPKASVIEQKNLSVSLGWFDSSVSFGEPGYEERETLDHGLSVAAASGFTHIAHNTNTNPLPTSKADISFLLWSAAHTPTTLHPKGHITAQDNAQQLAELHDLSQAGAICFSNHKQPIDDPHLLLLALQYARGFDGLVESFPIDPQLAVRGVMHEGKVSTSLGLTGIPNLAEEIRIRRDLAILSYTGGKLHIPTISSAEGVGLIRQAKKDKLDVSCSVAIHNLMMTDEQLDGFDTRYKLMPPLRESKDQKALLKGLKDGTIDMVTSDHQPMDIEHKKVELEHAAYGSLGLETAFGSLCTMMDAEDAALLLNRGKERFDVSQQSIQIGAQADLTLFTADGKAVVSKESILSSSKNSAYLGKELQGTVLGVINNNTFFENPS
ncbi:MAG: dihydroorotase [Flavobacteriaceae bacterium TMED81]|jgi:dihydroorotase|nr:MAG: dihydroorotase [Flavobacteriaceae bacterium TMED81]|tara:strand:- start:194 stop:1450 length:1257 start_codon:yes stop_codon:yes gene_type:complete